MLSRDTGFVTELSAKQQVRNSKKSDTPQLLPHNVEAEEAIIGALIVDPEKLIDISFLKPNDFHVINHGKMFEVIKSLFERSITPDLVTIIDELERREWLEQLGGDPAITRYVIDLQDKLFTFGGTLEHAKVVYRLSVRRQIIEQGTAIVQAAYSDDAEPETLQGDALERLTSIDTVRGAGDGVVKMQTATDLFLQSTMDIAENGVICGLSTGITALDGLLGGFQKNQTYLLAGRPGMGKSSLALTIARKIAHTGKKVLIFSLEMSKEKVAGRLVSQLSNVPYESFKNGTVPGDKWDDVFNQTNYVSQLPILIDDTPSLNVEAIRSRAQREAVKHGVDMIIIDHCGIVQPETRITNAYERANYIADKIMALPKLLNVPVLALLQLSRAVEARGDKRPQMSDLRDSGKWEENADGIMFVFRDEYYNEATEFPGVANLLLTKNRDGKTGQVSVYFQKDTMNFSDLAMESRPLNEV